MKVGLYIVLLLSVILSAQAQQNAKIQALLDKGHDVSQYNPDSALLIFKQALSLATGNDTVFLPRIYNRFAQAYSMKGNYAESSKFSIRALKMAEVLKDTVALIDANNNMGISWMYQEEYKKSLDYFYKVEKLSALSHDSLRWGHALNNLGLTLGYMGRIKEELRYYERAAEIFKKINELEGYTNTVLNTATVLTSEKKYQEAENLYKEALVIYQQIDYANAQGMVWQSLAENSRDAGHYQQALGYIREALKISKTNGYATEEANGLQLASTIFKKMKMFDSALVYLEQHRLLRDEIFNEEKNKISSELEAQYNNELKEQKIKDLEQENTIKDLRATTAQQWQIGLIIIIVLIVVVLGVLYNRYQLKQRTAKTLDEKNTELQKLNVFKDQMFAVISHDLRNPVDAFSTLMESLSENLEHASKEELKEFLDTTWHSARDLKALLNNLLEWSLVQIGRMPVNVKAESLKQLVTESVRHVNSLATSRHVSIQVSLPEEAIVCDKSMMLIIIRNLLTNAIKFSKQGGQVYITSKTLSDYTILAIRDEGIGMHANDVNKLFKPEENTRNIGSSAEKGAGIGLLLCKELAERNHTKISVESQVDVGSTFYLELPLA